MRSGETLIQRCGQQQRGFTYLGVLIAVIIIGITLTSAAEIWHTAQQRERERELLFVGDQIRQAIGGYYRSNGQQYPENLDDLLRDPHQPGVVRYLRKHYYDPMTGTSEWGLVKDGNGRIMGVFSNASGRPIKQANFSAADREFEGKESYAEWTFVYQLRRPRLKQSPVPPAPPANAVRPQK